MIIIAVIIFIVCSNLLLYLSERCVPEVFRVAFAVARQSLGKVPPTWHANACKHF